MIFFKDGIMIKTDIKREGYLSNLFEQEIHKKV
jgi:hypothetical protein